MFYVLDRTYLYAVVINLFGDLVLEEQSLAQWLKKLHETVFIIGLGGMGPNFLTPAIY